MMLSAQQGENPATEKHNDQARGPEDIDNSHDGSREDASAKRKHSDREPESPGQAGHEDLEPPNPKKERTFYGDMETDSPASYPKHVIVPAPDDRKPDEHQHVQTGQREDPHPHHVSFLPEQTGHGAQVLTPDSLSRGRPSDNSYDGGQQQYPPPHQQQPAYHDVYRAPSYTPEMDNGRAYGNHYHQGQHNNHYAPPPPRGGPAGPDSIVRPRRWACDYCNVATFLSYEEACAHEEACARRQHEPYPHDPSHQQPRPPAANYGPPPRGPHPGSGLGALYHASQEVVTPPTPHRQYYQPNRWGNHAPPLPVLPNEQGYYRQGYPDGREEPPHSYYPHHDPYYHQHHHHAPPPPPYHHPHHLPQEYYQKRMLLAMPSDRDSLSDRQCYVRSEMVEIFAATNKDVSARHSKGAQKLEIGQVGIRCVHCKHLRARDRAERAVCYPSSISRIYQTVADMQRFHFEQCREIPDHVRQVYKKLKTTRPRGVGSPQTYWVSSAKTMGLVDTTYGIRFDTDVSKDHGMEPQHPSADMSTSS